MISIRTISLLFIFSLLGGYLQAKGKNSTIPRDTSFSVYGTYVKERKKRPFIKIAKEEITDDIEFIDSLVYSTPYEGRELHVKVFRPKKAGHYPALLMVHGGGWNSGNFEMELPLIARIAKQAYVTMTVEYRLSPEAPYPAAVHDIKAAIKWVRSNAEFLKVDSSKIAIGGCSAGGQLAGLIGATNHQKEYETNKEHIGFSSEVQAVINIDGISNFVEQRNIDGVQADFEKGKKSASYLWLDGTYSTAQENWIAASAIYHITASSAPVCFINSSIPRFHDGRDEMREKLSQLGIYSEVHEFSDTPHPFWLFDPWAKPTASYITIFLDRMFKNK